MGYLIFIIIIYVFLLHLTGSGFSKFDDKKDVLTDVTRRSMNRNCTVKINKTELDCSNLGLNASHVSCQTLPLPEKVDCRNITVLNLSDNYFSQVSFTNFSKLQVLDLSLNPMTSYNNSSFVGLDQVKNLSLGSSRNKEFSGWTYYASEVFKPLTSLQNLDLSDRVTNLNPLMNPALCSLQKNVSNLKMNDMFWWGPKSFGLQFNLTTTKCFQNSSVLWLNMDGNNIYLITPLSVNNLKQLHYISLKRNNIIGDPVAFFYLPFIHNLTYLDMSLQSIRRPSPYGRESTTAYSPFVAFNITLWVLPLLETIKLDFTNGQRFTNLNFTRRYICFANNSLRTFKVTYVKFDSVVGTIPCMPKLEYLDIRGLRANELDPNLLADLPALETLLAGGAIPSSTFNSTNASIIFRNNHRLRHLDLSHLNLRSINIDMFLPLKQLQTLNLTSNRLSTIGEFQRLPNLTGLDVVNNQLTYLPYVMLKSLERNQKKHEDKKAFLNLTANPLLCTCETIDILDDYNDSSIEITHLKDGLLTCVIAANGVQIPVKDALKELIRLCHGKDMVPLIEAYLFYCVSLTSILILSALFNQRWKIWYAWYSIGRILLNRPSSDQNMYEFDAFISYSSKNIHWVQQCLVVNLEQCGYSLCLDYMHFVPGECIMDNIVSAIEVSRHTILIVTPSYIRSGWCDFELRCAQAHHIELRQSGIIAIVFPRVIQALKKHDRPSLSKLLDTVTYLEWPQDVYAKKVFWIRLKQALGDPVHQ